MIFYKTSGTPTGFSDPAVTGGTVGSGGTFNNTTPTPMQLGPLPSGSVYKSGNNVLYFTGLTQVPDPIVEESAIEPAKPRARCFAIQGPNGNILLENPPPGSLGSLSPTNFRGLGKLHVQPAAFEASGIESRAQHRDDLPRAMPSTCSTSRSGAPRT